MAWCRLVMEAEKLCLVEAVESKDQMSSQWIEKLLMQLSFRSWKFSLSLSQHGKQVEVLKHALTNTEAFAKVMLRDVTEELHTDSDKLLCLLIFRLWRSLPALLSESLNRLKSLKRYESIMGQDVTRAVWQEWLALVQTSPVIFWKRLVRLLLRRWKREVALESLVDALDSRAKRLYDEASDPVADWEHLVGTSLRKHRQQRALESVVDALDARALRTQMVQNQVSSQWAEKLLMQLSFRSWKFFLSLTQQGKQVDVLKHALTNTEAFAKVMLRDVTEGLHTDADKLLCLLIFRLWRSLSVNCRMMDRGTLVCSKTGKRRCLELVFNQWLACSKLSRLCHRHGECRRSLVELSLHASSQLQLRAAFAEWASEQQHAVMQTWLKQEWRQTISTQQSEDLRLVLRCWKSHCVKEKGAKQKTLQMIFSCWWCFCSGRRHASSRMSVPSSNVVREVFAEWRQAGGVSTKYFKAAD